MRKFTLIIIVFALFSGCNRVKQFTSPEQMVNQALKMVKTITVEELNKWKSVV